jgi:hypothetical protein
LAVPDTSQHNADIIRAKLAKGLSTLVGLDDNGIVNVIFGLNYMDEAGVIVVEVNDREHRYDTMVNAVAKATEAILSAMAENYWRRVYMLRYGQSLVALDWDEPMTPHAHTFKVVVPAGVGITQPKNALDDDVLKERLKQMLDRDHSVRFNVWYKHDGTVEVTIESIRGHIAPHVAAELMRRVIFVIGTMVRLSVMNNQPVVKLRHPFNAWVDDGSEPAEQYDEY